MRGYALIIVPNCRSRGTRGKKCEGHRDAPISARSQPHNSTQAMTQVFASHSTRVIGQTYIQGYVGEGVGWISEAVRMMDLRQFVMLSHALSLHRSGDCASLRNPSCKVDVAAEMARMGGGETKNLPKVDSVTAPTGTADAIGGPLANTDALPYSNITPLRH
jgi:hypothetical protein